MLAAAPTDGKEGFEALKKLEGTWTQTQKDGAVSQVTLSVVAGGSAILEQHVGRDRTRVSAASVYHLDNGALVMTHYGAEGNHPRMKATSVEAQRIRFETTDVLNLKSASAPHVSAVTFAFKDTDHLTQEWTTKQDGKVTKHVVELTRKYVDTLK